MLNITPIGKQKEVIERRNGNYAVLGAAGSGKSLMALLRAEKLCREHPAENVLIVTFNKALVNSMKAMEGGSMPVNLTIRTCHSLAFSVLRSKDRRSKELKILDDKDKEELISQARDEIRKQYPDETTLARPEDFFADEIAFIQSFGLVTMESYESAHRIGRAEAYLARKNRKYVFAVYEKYLELRKDLCDCDWTDMAYYAVKEMKENGAPRQYDHIIIDEGQDFTPMMIQSIIMQKKPSGSFMFFADEAQQIYGRRISFRSLGLRVRSIIRFTANYRSTASILAFSEDIRHSDAWLSNEEMVSPVCGRTDHSDILPVLHTFKTEEDETAWVLKQASRSSLDAATAVIVRRRETIADLERRLKKAGMPCTILDRRTGTSRTDSGLYLTTFHAAKGLEFDDVYIPYLSAGSFPDPKALEGSYDPAETEFEELKLFYVAVTRTRRNLYMTCTEEPTELFPLSSSHYRKENDCA